jgi:membrane protein implicated in regulation of membrane protease activity
MSPEYISIFVHIFFLLIIILIAVVGKYIDSTAYNIIAVISFTVLFAALVVNRLIRRRNKDRNGNGRN